jgi:hypothetical protein
LTLFGLPASLALAVILLSEFIYRDRFFACDASLSRVAAAAIDSGKKVVFRTNDFPDKCVVVAVVSRWASARDIVAIGSSRTMQLRAELFPGRSFYNASVFAARINEYFAVVHLLESHGKLPRQLVLGVDAWSLDAHDADDRWVGFAFEARAFIRMLSQDSIATSSELRRSLWWAYLRSWSAQAGGILRRFGHHISPRGLASTARLVRTCWCLNPMLAGMSIVAGNDEATHIAKLPDGSVLYQLALRNRSVRDLAEEGQASSAAYLRSRHAVSPELLLRLWLLVDHLRARGVEVTFWAAPYHPSVYRSMIGSANGRFIAEVEIALRRGAAERGMRVVGSYDPSKVPCLDAEFIDWIHPKDICLARAFLRPDDRRRD